MSVPGGEAPRRGRTQIDERALRHLAAHLGADEAGVAARDVHVGLGDTAGALAATVTLPLVVDEEVPRPVAEQATAVRERIISGMAAMAGRTTGSVNVRFSGIQERVRRRVR